MLETYDDILTIPEVADVLKIGTSQTYKIVRAGQLKGFKKGKINIFPYITYFVNRLAAALSTITTTSL